MINHKKRVEEYIKKIYEQMFKKILKKNRVYKNLKTKEEIEKYVENLENSKSFEIFTKKYSKKLSTLSLLSDRKLWKKYFKESQRKNVSIYKTYDKFEKAMYKKIIRKNYTLIKSIPQKVLYVYKEKSINILIKEVLEGKKPRGSLEELLKQKGAKHARLIARTESAKLQTAVDENMSTELGSVCYKWDASNDKRTRPSHRAMNGVIVFWRRENEKPYLDKMYGNAGEFPNCRCAPIPIFNEDDLKENIYKVYDYRNHKIVKKTKKELLGLIKNGGF